MNVLAINKFFFRGAGAETVFFDTNELLEETGHVVVPFAMQHERNVQSPWQTYFARRRDYVGGRASARAVDAAASVYSLEARRRLRELLQAFQPDVAHLHNVYHQLTLSIVDELHRAGVPMVMTVHDYKPVCPNYRLLADDGPCQRCLTGAYRNAVIHRCVKGSRAASAVAALEARVNRITRRYERIDRFVAPSSFLRDVLIGGGFPPDRIDVIPNPVKVERFAESDRCERPLFVYFGRLAPEKGLSTLLDAASLLKERDILIEVYGSGPLESELRARIRRDELPVEVRGLVPPTAVASVLSTARAAVLPSTWFENCPMSILEAAAARVPTIASRIGGIPELIEDGRTGILVTPHDSEELAAAVGNLAGDAKRASQLGAAAQERVEARHSPTRYRDALLAAYRVAGSEPLPHQALVTA